MEDITFKMQIYDFCVDVSLVGDGIYVSCLLNNVYVYGLRNIK